MNRVGCPAYTMNDIYRFLYFLSALFFAFWGALPCAALEKENVIVIVNKNVRESVLLADYYVKKRGISKKQQLFLKTVTTESCSRNDYERDIVLPVRNYLMKRKLEPNATCLVLMYGVPLKIAPSDPVTGKIGGIAYDTQASVDSELSMIYEPNYPSSGWIKNPMCVVNRQKSLFVDEENVFMVCRLDGPTREIVKRMIDDSIETEKIGLKGNACFDARWPMEYTGKMNAYSRFDKFIHAAANVTRQKNMLPVKLDASQSLFQPGDCPNTAIYCGWYSLAKYVDAFSWAKGAVGYHVASAECRTLKNKDSRVWCKVMLEKGVAATLGPVGEPYLQSFPRPDIFFGFLFDGNCLVESYMKSTPYLSWKMVLIGDPLYRPF